MRKTLVLPIAGLLVIGAAGMVFASTASPSAGTTGTVVPAAASPSPGTSAAPVEKDTVLSGVLDDLVTKGTITRAQADAILSALDAKRTALRTERQQEREQLRTFLEDGVITQAEIDQLPADSPIRQLTTLLDDGKITLDELRSLGRGILGGGMGHGFGRGGGMWGLPAPDASPAPSSGTSG